jgi:hypothetical protein
MGEDDSGDVDGSKFELLGELPQQGKDGEFINNCLLFDRTFFKSKLMFQLKTINSDHEVKNEFKFLISIFL